jgi:hypothetical protein
VPIAGGTRCSIGIFSYLNTMTFGINADFDGYPDVDVLSGGIRKGIEELLALAEKKGAASTSATAETTAAEAPAKKSTAATSTGTTTTAAKKAAPRKSAPRKSASATGG